MMRSILLATTLALLPACGSGSTTTVGDAGTTGGVDVAVSCDVPANNLCVDYHWTAGDYSTAQASQACRELGGTSGDRCSHAGAIGGCQVALITSPGHTLSTVAWYRTGTVDTIAAQCRASNGTFLTP